jgi:predicted nucleic acid-binding Zn finger protein
MRIDIITLHAVQNYGSALQALATQELFKEHGCDVKIINYVRENVRPENLFRTWGKGNPIKTLVMVPTVYRWRKVFTDFTRAKLNLTDKIYTTDEDFHSYILEADGYCTGSDQVWNSKWNRGILPCLYLDFVPENFYKFSFAASFGQEKISDEEVAATKKYIEQYNRISVREDNAKKIIEERYCMTKAVHIVDPTLCVTGDFWRKYESQRKIKEEYILVYNLNRSKEFDQFAVKLSKKTRLKLVRFCTRYDQFYRPGKSMLVPEVVDFISLIDNAKYVLTDSFHATAFSLNLSTEPICIYPKEFGGRLESLLVLTDSLHRFIKDYNDFDVLNRPVDFEKVNNILLTERKKANDFIETVISDIKKGIA